MFKVFVILTTVLLLVTGVFAQDDSITLYDLDDRPVLGTTAAGQDILLGGFSGLWYDGMTEDGNWLFITHPDRGPNADPADTDGDGVNERPFPLPDFQARLVFIEVNPEAGTAEIVDQLMLTDGDGNPITGLPNFEGEAGMAYADEIPIDLMGNVLDYDPLGADMEGIVRAEDGTFWMVDEYRPAIYHFTDEGVLANRYVPAGTPEEGGTGALPEVFAQRRANRGFEAVAIDGTTLYAFIQSPIDNPDVSNDDSSKNSVVNRIVEFDTTTGETIGEYIYIIEGDSSDKIGDAVALGNGEFLVIERDSAVGEDSLKKIFRISLEGATNWFENMDMGMDDMPLESMTAEDMEMAGIVPVSKEVVVDLPAIGYLAGDKPEGLALIDENTVAVINDNDFGLVGTFDPETGLLDDNENPIPVILGVIDISE